MIDPNAGRLSALISGYVISQAIACAARLGISDLVAGGPRSGDELAALIGCSPSHLHRLLRALSEIGVYRFSGGLVAQTPMSELLCSDHAHGLRSHALFHGSEMYKVFGGLHENVVTGEPAWDTIIGEPIWSYLASHPERGAVFDDSMRTHQSRRLAEMAAAIDLGTPGTIVDVGGGDGALLEEALRQHPAARGILVDTPEVVDRAIERHASRPAMERCEFRGCDMFSGIPAGADVYFLKHVLHDWEDDDCLRILAAFREAMSGASVLVIMESPMGSTHSLYHGWRDLSMMVAGGRERTFEEYEDLVLRSGMAVSSRRQAAWGDAIAVTLPR